MIRIEMSKTEQRLKHVYLERTDIHNKIISSDELSEYIAWMISANSGYEHLQESDPMMQEKNRGITDLIQTIASDPDNISAFGSLASIYRFQREETHMNESYDISVGRMMRYMPAHWHTDDYFELYYCCSGDVPIHFQDEIIQLKQGSAMIIAPNVRHASPCYADDAVLLYFLIRSSTFETVFWNQLPSNSLMASFFKKALSRSGTLAYLQFETGEDSEIEHILYQIGKEFIQKSSYSAQMLNSLMSLLFIMILQRYEGTAKLPRTENFYWKHEYSHIISFIQENYLTMSLSDISEQLGYSERQITRILLACTGENYAELTLRMKMEHAAFLLDKKHMDIKSVSEQCGYANLSSFYRSFSRYHGITPAQYAEKHSV